MNMIEMQLHWKSHQAKNNKTNDRPQRINSTSYHFAIKSNFFLLQRTSTTNFSPLSFFSIFCTIFKHAFLMNFFQIIQRNNGLWRQIKPNQGINLTRLALFIFFFNLFCFVLFFVYQPPDKSWRRTHWPCMS